jgi:hypothetical protein
MKIGNLMIALVSAIAGGLLVALLVGPHQGSTSAGKSDRLGGAPTETVFLPERFGVPGTSQ